MNAIRERLTRASDKIAQRLHLLKPNRSAAVAILLGLTVTLAG